LEKRFELRLDGMKKAQKKDIEKLETSQEAYFKNKTKKLKQEQVKNRMVISCPYFTCMC